jgi:N-methylhydantoinase A
MRKQKLYGETPPSAALATRRSVFFEQHDGVEETPVYIREQLQCGNRLGGPAVIEQYDATTVVYPKLAAEVDGFGNLVLTVAEGG